MTVDSTVHCSVADWSTILKPGLQCGTLPFLSPGSQSQSWYPSDSDHLVVASSIWVSWKQGSMGVPGTPGKGLLELCRCHKRWGTGRSLHPPCFSPSAWWQGSATTYCTSSLLVGRSLADRHKAQPETQLSWEKLWILFIIFCRTWSSGKGAVNPHFRDSPQLSVGCCMIRVKSLLLIGFW